MITGITLIRNGHILGYPFVQCIRNMAEKCDEVLVNVGKSDDDTLATVYQLQRYYPNIRVFQTTWDMSNTGDGSELAKQANALLPKVNPKTKWIVYVQADEIIDWGRKDHLKEYLWNLPDKVSQVELYRTYFWKDLKHRAPKYEIYLGRIFRPGTHKVGGDGMHLVRFSGEVVRSAYWIYHYSRMGPEEKVAARVKNLDQLFHDDVSVTPTFSYDTDIELVPYEGTHPEGIEEFYGEVRLEQDPVQG